MNRRPTLRATGTAVFLTAAIPLLSAQPSAAQVGEPIGELVAGPDQVGALLTRVREALPGSTVSMVEGSSFD